MAGRSIGNIGEYDPKSGNWETYELQLRFYIEANLINDAKQQRAVLLSTIGAQAVQVAVDLNFPTKLNDDAVTFELLLEQLGGHYGNKQAVIAARAELRRTKQSEEIGRASWRERV